MTILTSTSREILAGNGVADAFPFTFPILVSSDMLVTLVDEDGTQTVQTENVDYTVSGAGDESGGTVTFTTPPGPGVTVLLQRNVPFTQPTDYKNQGSFYPRTHERSFDRLTMQVQQLKERIDAALTLPPQVTGVSTQLPTPEASDLIGWDSLGLGLTNIPPSQVASVAAFADWQTQSFLCNGTQTIFPLTGFVPSAAAALVVLDGVVQVLGDDYGFTNFGGVSRLQMFVAPSNGQVLSVRWGTTIPVLPTAVGIDYTAPLAGAVTRSVAARLGDRFSVRDFGATGDGATDDAAAINLAISATFAVGGGTVYFPKGVYLIQSAVLMKAGVRLLGEDRGNTIIRQAAGANLNPMIEFGFPVTANGAGLKNLCIDANSDNNTLGTGVFTIHVRTAVAAEFIRCLFLNSPGFFIATNGVRTRAAENVFDGCYMAPMFAFHALPAPTDAYTVFEDNYCINSGGGSILLEGSNFGVVRRNRIIGTLIGGRNDRMTVDTSGTTVTWVSGPNFANARAGMFVVLNNGAEFRITAKVSDTQLTVDPALPTLSGTQAGIGTGDLIGNLYSSNCQITDNVCVNSATYGMGGVIGGTAYQCSNNTWERNTISNTGKHAINITYDGGAGLLDMNSVIGNKIVNPGSCGGIATSDKVGIYLFSGSPGKLTNTYVEGNTVISAVGDGQTEYWMAVDGAGSPGSVFVGKNVNSGMVNVGIGGDIVSAVLDAGWGDTATVTDIYSFGSAVRFNINCAGAGISWNPGVTITKICGSVSDPPIINGKLIGSTAATYRVFGENNSTRGAWRIFIDGTPAAGETYIFTVIQE